MSLPSPTRRLLAAIVLAVLALSVPASASAEEPAAGAAPTLREPGTTGPLGNARLSNERTVTRVARARYQSPIYRHPSPRAAKLANLRFMTEDGFPEVYLVLESRVDSLKRTWLHIRIPGRPNGRTGWVLERKLGSMRMVDTFLHIRRGRDARLYRGSTLIWQAPVGTGAASTPTPAGRFWIREKFRGSGGIYGPYVFGTAAYSVLSEWPRGGVIGIHGTNQPGLIPGRPSHGCVRVRNHQITQLYRLMPVGTPLLIT